MKKMRWIKIFLKILLNANVVTVIGSWKEISPRGASPKNAWNTLSAWDKSRLTWRASLVVCQIRRQPVTPSETGLGPGVLWSIIWHPTLAVSKTFGRKFSPSHPLFLMFLWWLCILYSILICYSICSLYYWRAQAPNRRLMPTLNYTYCVYSLQSCIFHLLWHKEALFDTRLKMQMNEHCQSELPVALNARNGKREHALCVFRSLADISFTRD